jgi:hypothetical protein
MSDRDELAEVIQNNLYATDGCEQIGLLESEEIADAILAAGYRNPRTVTTAEELDALPRYSVIRTHQDDVYTKHYDFYEESDNWEARDRMSIHTHDLPATVLHTPEPQP